MPRSSVRRTIAIVFVPLAILAFVANFVNGSVTTSEWVFGIIVFLVALGAVLLLNTVISKRPK